MKRLFAITAVAIVAGSVTVAEACSRAVFKSNYGTVISRTTDWAVDVHPTFGKVGRDQVYQMHNGNELPVKYGYIGFYEVHGKVGIEAHNEAGLSAALLYDSTAGYSKDQLDPAQGDVSLLMLTDYVASQFATVDEAVANLKSIDLHAGIVDIPDQGKKHMPVHFQLNDKQGNVVVIEFRDGNVAYYENQAVMTNAPQIPEQLENLDNYKPWGGDLNMPGDIDSKDRFVRISNALAQIQEQNAPTDATVAYVQGRHLLHAMSLGQRQYSVYDAEAKGKYGTLWTTYYDTSEGKIVFQSTKRLNPVVIDMNRVDFESGRVTFDAEEVQGDVTDALNPTRYALK